MAYTLALGGVDRLATELLEQICRRDNFSIVREERVQLVVQIRSFEIFLRNEPDLTAAFALAVCAVFEHSGLQFFRAEEQEEAEEGKSHCKEAQYDLSAVERRDQHAVLTLLLSESFSAAELTLPALVLLLEGGNLALGESDSRLALRLALLR